MITGGFFGPRVLPKFTFLISFIYEYDTRVCCSCTLHNSQLLTQLLPPTQLHPDSSSSVFLFIYSYAHSKTASYYLLLSLLLTSIRSTELLVLSVHQLFIVQSHTLPTSELLLPTFSFPFFPIPFFCYIASIVQF
jgi:hypothetical protein